MPDEYRCKNPQQNISKPSSAYIKKIIHHDQVEFIPGMKGCFNICKSINVVCHKSKMKHKNYMNLTIAVVKTFNKCFHDESL